jgi:chromate transporter
MISLGKKALKTVELGIIGVIAAGFTLLGANEILVLFGSGAIGILLYWIKRKHTVQGLFPFFFLQAANLPVDISNWKIFLIFLKVGSILYGSGYVLFAFLEAELVGKGLLSRRELIDAIAVGQFTPGPVFSSATFIGWQIGGLPGAVAATVGIFLPSFLFVALLNPVIPKLRKSKLMSAFLDAVNVASVAVILAVCVQMARESITDWRMILIAVISLTVSLFYKKVNSAFVVTGGAVLGYLLWLL